MHTGQVMRKRCGSLWRLTHAFLELDNQVCSVSLLHAVQDVFCKLLAWPHLLS